MKPDMPINSAEPWEHLHFRLFQKLTRAWRRQGQTFSQPLCRLPKTRLFASEVGTGWLFWICFEFYSLIHSFPYTVFTAASNSYWNRLTRRQSRCDRERRNPWSPHVVSVLFCNFIINCVSTVLLEGMGGGCKKALDVHLSLVFRWRQFQLAAPWGRVMGFLARFRDASSWPYASPWPG